jgi:hypothetical protein
MERSRLGPRIRSLRVAASGSLRIPPELHADKLCEQGSASSPVSRTESEAAVRMSFLHFLPSQHYASDPRQYWPPQINTLSTKKRGSTCDLQPMPSRKKFALCILLRMGALRKSVLFLFFFINKKTAVVSRNTDSRPDATAPWHGVRLD